MRKIILLIFLMFFNYVVIAQEPKDKAIYCPDKITCINNSCTFLSEDPKYFGKISIRSNDGSPLSLSYLYKSTVAYFRSNYIGAYCDYGNLYLKIKDASNLEPYRIEGSSWIGKKTLEICSGNCPLHESMGFVIINSIHPGGVYASINQQDISKLITENSHIIFDDTLLQCTGVKECVIDIQSDQRKIFGNIVIDMDTMKIVQVNSLDPTIKIDKIYGLNAIEINKIDERKEQEAVYCPPVLKCSKAYGCTFASIDAKYFGEIRFSVVTSTDELLKFSSAIINDPSLKESICYYGSSVQAKSSAALLTNPEFHFDAYYNMLGSKWIGLRCTSSSAQDCPFSKRFDVVIHNVNVGNGLYASIENTYTSQLFSNDSYLSITQSNTVGGCDGKTECVINLFSSQHAKYGSITIDMKTMEVLKTDSLYPNYIKISKISNTESNLVDVSYITDLKFIPKNLR